MSALRKVRGALDSDEELYRLQLGGLHDWIGHLLALEPRAAGEGALVRLDASLARTHLHFIEVNADTPGGAGHNDAILDFFEAMPTYERLDLEHYASRGFEAVGADPSQLSFEAGRLRMGGVAVDLVHRACPTGGFLGGARELEPLFEALRAEAVCLVNPFRSELLGHKAIFALLTDPRHDFGFDAAERAAIREHVPWARSVIEGRTTDPDGNEVDLVEYLRGNRQRLVLKPAHDFGGHGVVLGWHEDEASWRSPTSTPTAASASPSPSRRPASGGRAAPRAPHRCRGRPGRAARSRSPSWSPRTGCRSWRTCRRRRARRPRGRAA